MTHLYLDLETIPTKDHQLIAMLRADADAGLAEALEAVKPHGAMKDPDKIADDIAKRRAKLINEHPAAVEAAHVKTSLDGTYGQIVVIGYAIDDGKPQTIRIGDAGVFEEAEMLDAFFAELRPLGRVGSDIRIVGHNVIGFDLPFLWKRSIIHGVEPPGFIPRDVKPWERAQVFDTMTSWAGHRGYISLHRLCRVLGIDSDDTTTGADVWALVQAGKIDAVAAHCRADVDRVRAVHRRMSFAEVALRKAG